MAIIDMINAPWAMDPKAHGEMIEIYETHLKGDKIDIAALEARLGGPLAGPVQGYEVIHGVAVLPIDGLISKRMNMMTKISGGTSLELLGRDFNAAMNDPAVHSIILQVDSPGGATMGLQEVGQTMFASRGRKSVVALTDGMMASAAYWLGSAADQVFISSDTTLVGSIGVIYRHVDRSGADAKAGLKVTEVYAGKYKTMASDTGPLSDAARADIQAKVDTLYSLFVNTVAQHRGVDAQTVLDQMAEGRVFLGREAIKAGLVDGVATLDQLITRLNTRSQQSAAGVAALAVTSDPDDAVAGAPAASETTDSTLRTTMTITKDFILANHPDIAEAFRSEGYARGQSEATATGAASERARIQAVEATAMPGCDALIAKLKFDGTTTGAEAAQQVLAHYKSQNGTALAALTADAAALPKVPATPSAAGDQGAASDAGLSIDERAKKRWDASSDLRAEFADDYNNYLAYAKAADRGKVRILGKKAA